MNWIRNYKIWLLLLIIGLGGLLRFFNLNWDQDSHLHPDERFLTMVMTDMSLPGSLSEYFNQDVSEYNPRNIGHDLFVYGSFPTTLNKTIALLIGNDNYDELTQQGRFLSALMDVLMIILVFFLTKLLANEYKKNIEIAYWSAFIYAILVLPIQLSHFFATDLFASLFMMLSLYGAVRFALKQKWRWLILSGIGLGLALGSKVNGVFILPLNLSCMILIPLTNNVSRIRKATVLKRTTWTFVVIMGYLLAIYITLRMVDPYVFESNNWLNPSISRVFIENIETLKSWSNAEVWFPPAIQWIGKTPVLYSTVQMAILGLGIPIFAMAVLGVCLLIGWWWKNRRSFLPMLILSWMMGVYLYQSIQFAKALRYLIFIYPLLAILAGVGVWFLVKQVTTRWRLNKALISLVMILSFMIWPVMFMSVYVQDHSRIQASRWIYENIPVNSMLLTEHWDDGLPLPIATHDYVGYESKQLPVFGEDNAGKWNEMNELLDEGDYYLLSSNRAWASIMKAPRRYPRMSQFYIDLFKGEKGYKKVAEFSSYPSLRYLGIPISLNDDWMDETFTVYDHPKVMIYKKL